ncbi:kinase-like domain-containing protein [Xylogone sp. PMI_703]|nr:kinase-like domain-containing protein [Xylogone sp. PMI_703]
MAEAIPQDDDGWQLVVNHPATEVREIKQIEQWEQSKGHWSGIGKHPLNFTDHKKLHLSREKYLGEGSSGRVERITYKAVTMARKHVKLRGRTTLEKVREEANIMERLVHRHIVRLIGTYTYGDRNLYLLLYPAAVCDLHHLLEDIDDIRGETHPDLEEAYRRLHLLGLKQIGSIRDLTEPENHSSSPQSTGITSTAVRFLQQMLGCITEALAFVHKKDVRHRDLNPKNILLSPGRVYLADFGIARVIAKPEDTITNGRCGTPWWYAPEVSNEMDHHMSPADIYSLGCIFLIVANIIYGEPLEKYERVMKEPSWTKKYDNISKYMLALRTKAAAAGLVDGEEPNFKAKNLCSLTERMLSYSPEERPSAEEVGIMLTEYGGLDQIYHLHCCRKNNTHLSEIINAKFNAIHENNAQSHTKASRLESQNAELQKRITHLESFNGTFEQRIDNERKHAGKQYEALLEKYHREIEARKNLEARLRFLELETRKHHNNQQTKRPPLRLPAKSKGQNVVTIQPNGHDTTNGNGNVNILQQKEFPFYRRPSRVPIPTRPSTPIRPTYTRDPTSSSSTLDSSVHSTFSQSTTMTEDSMSSLASSTVLQSPTTATPISPSPSTISHQKPGFRPSFKSEKTVVKNEALKNPSFSQQTSWAAMAAKSGIKS